MKRILIYFCLAAVALFTFSGCNFEQKSDDQETKDESSLYIYHLVASNTQSILTPVTKVTAKRGATVVLGVQTTDFKSPVALWMTSDKSVGELIYSSVSEISKRKALQSIYCRQTGQTVITAMLSNGWTAKCTIEVQ